MAPAPTRAASVIVAWCAAGIYVAAGLAFAVDAPIWAGLAALAALVGLVLKTLWFNPWLSLGVALDVAVLAAVLAG